LLKKKAFGEIVVLSGERGRRGTRPKKNRGGRVKCLERTDIPHLKRGAILWGGNWEKAAAGPCVLGNGAAHACGLGGTGCWGVGDIPCRMRPLAENPPPKTSSRAGKHGESSLQGEAKLLEGEGSLRLGKTAMQGVKELGLAWGDPPKEGAWGDRPWFHRVKREG